MNIMIQSNFNGMDGLVIIEKLNDLSMYTRIMLKQFPKYEKFLMAGEIRSSLVCLKRLIIRAMKRYYKKTTLEDADIELELLRSLVREAVSLRYIDFHKQEVWMRKAGEVGAILGSWIKRVNAKVLKVDSNVIDA